MQIKLSFKSVIKINYNYIYIFLLQVVILLTDGNQTGSDKAKTEISLTKSVQPLKDLNAKIIAIAIGSVDRKQLLELVEKDEDILTPKNFDDLINYVKQTISYSCRGNYYFELCSCM